MITEFVPRVAVSEPDPEHRRISHTLQIVGDDFGVYRHGHDE